jgi:purine nucleosidase
MSRPLVIDTDPGVDDALALLMALACPDVEVIAVTGVAGNVAIDPVMHNIGVVLELADSDAPFYRGCERSLIGEARTSAGYHGPGGLGAERFPAARRAADAGHAAAAIGRLCRERPGEVTILALGPLTNVAVALALEPELPRLVERIVWMGGTVHARGNITAAAEFNAWVDPEAAARVLGCGAPLTLLSWEATLAHLLGWEDLERLIGAGTPLADFARRITAEMADFERARRLGGFPVPDPLAAAVCLDPQAARTEARPVEVELAGRHTRGQLVVDERPGRGGPPHVDIVRAVAMDRVVALLAAGLAGRD